MKIFTPDNSSELAARNSLLQKSLREPGLNFSIESEYPIVLSDHGKQFSFCFQEGQELIAHANLWPRVVTCKITKQTWNIGLIGNVATDERFRGRGIMSTVLDNLKNVAMQNNLALLVLWSDLLEFYQKQGFRSFGEEIRYIFTSDMLQSLRPDAQIFVKPQINVISDDDLGSFLKLRPESNPTLERSLPEFRQMLSIPQMEFFCGTTRDGQMRSFAVLGKGADMDAVIHEWGAKDPDDMLPLIQFLLNDSGRQAGMLLTPKYLSNKFHSLFSRYAAIKEQHPMALVWCNPNCSNSDSLSKLFIWGLDSI